MRNRFNEQFATALDSKLTLQGAQTEQALSRAAINRETVPTIQPDSVSRNALQDSQAAVQNLATDTLSSTGEPEGFAPAPAFGGFEAGAISAGNQVGRLNSVPGGSRFSLDSSLAPQRFAEGGPVDADYDLYRQAAADAGLPELDYQIAIPAMAQMRAAKRAKVLKQIASGATTPGFADGGSVDVGGALVRGAGTGKSDSIPAVIDGERPAALSNGEFVVPKNIVEYYGTKFFDGLVDKAREVAGKQKRKADKTAQSAGAV